MPTAHQTFLKERDRRNVWLVEVSPYNPSTGLVETLRFSNTRFATGPNDSPAHKLYKAKLLTPWLFNAPAQPAGTVGLLPAPGGGEVVLGGLAGDLDYLKSTGYLWDGRAITCRHGGYSRTLGRNLTLAEMASYTAELDQALVGLNTVRFLTRDKSEMFRKPLQFHRFTGSAWGVNMDSGGTDWLQVGAGAGAPSNCSLTGDHTIVARWRQRTSASGDHSGILSWQNGAGTAAYPFKFGYVESASLGKQLFWGHSGSGEPGGTHYSQFGTPIVVGRWYVVAVTVSGTAVTFYLYDEVTGLVQTYATTTSGARATALGTLAVNRHSDTTPLSAQMDFVQLWSTVKTQSEILDLGRRQLSATEKGDATLRLYLQGEDGSGTTATNGATSTGSAGDATFQGTPEWFLALNGGLVTGGTAGDVFLEGVPKPDPWGEFNEFPPVEVWPLTRIFCVSGTKVESILTCKEGGYPLDLDAAYTDPDTFLAATTDPGTYDTLIWDGGSFIRLGSTPSKPITVTGKGNIKDHGLTGSTADTAVGSVVKAILKDRAGLVDADFVTSAMSDLDTDTGSKAVQFVATADTTIEEAVNFLLGGAGCFGYWTRAGLFNAELFIGEGASADHEIDERLIVSMEPLPVELPLERLILLCARNWRPLAKSDLSADILGKPEEQDAMAEGITINRNSRTNHLRARELYVNSSYRTRAAGEAEATRLMALYSGEAQAYEIVLNAASLNIDRFQTINAKYRDRSTTGAVQHRLNLTSSGKKFLVLGVGEGQGPLGDVSETTLVVYRKQA